MEVKALWVKEFLLYEVDLLEEDWKIVRDGVIYWCTRTGLLGKRPKGLYVSCINCWSASVVEWEIEEERRRDSIAVKFWFLAG